MWATPEWIGNSQVPDIPAAMRYDKPTINTYKPLNRRLWNTWFSSEDTDSEVNMKTSKEDNERIKINVSGRHFETRLKTLNQFPNTLLGNPQMRKKYYDETRQEYFFDRHRESFEGIIYYYQSKGHLLKPVTVPVQVFLKEVKYFQLGRHAVRKLKQEEGFNSSLHLDLPSNPLQQYLWLIVEYPLSSTYAKIFSIISITFIFASVVSFCFETLPYFSTYTVNMQNEKPVFDLDYDFFSKKFYYLELAFMVWFTFEILIRFLCCPSKKAYFKDVLNIIDIISVLPFYISIIGYFIEMGHGERKHYLEVLRFIRIIRVLRIFKLTRHSKGLQVLGKTITASCHELFMLLFFLMVCVVIFATMVYFAEMDSNPNSFISIPDSFWWAVVTMTTVGYGDMHPKSVAGKLVGCFCAVVGVLTIALPVPVIVSNFNYFYTKEKESEQLFPVYHFDKLPADRPIHQPNNIVISKKVNNLFTGLNHKPHAIESENEPEGKDTSKRSSENSGENDLEETFPNPS